MGTIAQKGAIYLIHNTVSNKVYVGQTVKGYTCNRWSDHAHRLRKGTHANPHLQASWNKYGKDAFEFCVIEEHATLEDLNAAECFWIEYLHSLGVDLYNTKQGGLNGRHSEESRQKRRGIKYPAISEMLRKRPITEKQRTASQRAQLAKGIVYQLVDPYGETHSFSLINEFAKAHGLNSKTLSQLLLGRLIAHKGWTRPGETRKMRRVRPLNERIVAQIQLPRQYEFISPAGEIFVTDNANAFCKAHGLSSGHISEVIAGKRAHNRGWKVRRIL